MSEDEAPLCPLCASADGELWCADMRRSYQRCGNCRLIWVPPRFHLSMKAEKAEYDLHQNSPDDQDYRGFLSRLFDPMNRQIAANSHGLDFGCGPGPTLSVMFEEAGHDVDLYDPFYADVQNVLRRRYDFVTASEVVEHFRDPPTGLARLWQCVRDGGVLGIMTKRPTTQSTFANWHYKNDLTHVSFYSDETFCWLANCWGAELEIVGADVVLFKRRDKKLPCGRM